MIKRHSARRCTEYIVTVNDLDDARDNVDLTFTIKRGLKSDRDFF